MTLEAAYSSIKAVIGFATAIVIAPIPLAAAGFHPFAVQGHSMVPSIRSGDAIITRMVEPASLHVGDVVTFSAREAQGRSFTHRVVNATRRGQTFHFETKGDASTNSEHWSIDADEQVGRLAVRLPRVGFVARLLSGPIARLGLVLLLVALMFQPTVQGGKRPSPAPA
jgi:signal peptidase